MKNASEWHPTKFIEIDGRLRANQDPEFVAKSSRLVVDLLAAMLQPAVERYARGHLLDVGCGAVPLYNAYKPEIDRVTCVDWPQSLHKSSHVDIAADLNDGLPFRSGVADTVIATDVLEHLRDPLGLLQEVSRVLRPGGHAILTTPFCYWVHEGPHDYFRFTEFGLRSMVEQAELNVEVLERGGGGLDVIADCAGKLIMGLPIAGRQLSTVLQSAALVLGRTAAGRSIRERTSDRFVLEYMVVASKPRTEALTVNA
jgi:SAM-dependent methyltransferase